jgi:hypothetical protein
MMRIYVTSGSLTWGTKLDEGPDGSYTTPFPEENTVMTVYGGCPPLRRRHMSNLNPSTPTRSGRGLRGLGVCVCVYIYI